MRSQENKQFRILPGAYVYLILHLPLNVYFFIIQIQQLNTKHNCLTININLFAAAHLLRNCLFTYYINCKRINKKKQLN